MKFLISEQEALHFQFAVGPANYGASLRGRCDIWFIRKCVKCVIMGKLLTEMENTGFSLPGAGSGDGHVKINVGPRSLKDISLQP